MSVDPEFDQRNRELTARMADDRKVGDVSREWLVRTIAYEYCYHFTWLGLPIIQMPIDVVAIQEVIWKVRPQLIIETGVARGGSMIFYASLLELMGGDGRVVGVELALRPHNRRAITEHPLARRIDLIDGSSIAPGVVAQVREKAAGRAPVLVILDSNHTHQHVLQELDLYGPLVTKDSYMIVLDTIIEDVPKSLYMDRAYGPGDNPKTAVAEFLTRTTRFAVDEDIDRKLLISAGPRGYLRCLG